MPSRASCSIKEGSAGRKRGDRHVPAGVPGPEAADRPRTRARPAAGGFGDDRQRGRPVGRPQQLCQESGVGAEVDPLRIPLSRALKAYRKDPLSLALHGGEDFQLIFTVRPSALPRLEPLRKRFRLTDIGRVVGEKGIWTVDVRGRRKVARDQGYEHFQVGPGNTPQAVALLPSTRRCGYLLTVCIDETIRLEAKA